MLLTRGNLGLFIVFFMLVAFIEESVGKPQCGLRWRSRCKIPQIGRQVPKESRHNFDLDKIEEEILQQVRNSVDETAESEVTRRKDISRAQQNKPSAARLQTSNIMDETEEGLLKSYYNNLKYSMDNEDYDKDDEDDEEDEINIANLV